MALRMHRVEYGFLTARPSAIVSRVIKLLQMQTSSETEALARVKQIEADNLKRYGPGTEIVILKVEPVECR